MGNHIAEIRRQAGFSSQEQLARHINIKRLVIAKWEAGITTPRYKTLLKIADALGCTADHLLRPPANPPQQGKAADA